MSDHTHDGDREGLGFGPVCGECAPKPLGLTTDQVDPRTLVGLNVKVGIKTDIEEGKGPTQEHIWVKLMILNDDGSFAGFVNSEPVALLLERGNRITVKLEDIEDIYREGSA